MKFFVSAYVYSLKEIGKSTKIYSLELNTMKSSM